ncbi:NifU family protein [Nitrospira tepida]|uniref:NifU family protein n=1 Tax=Nitrospira tepida TaxID=2973512 RepID=UPI00259CD1F9|nr:NifU family protein [Nitrospira tepida]
MLKSIESLEAIVQGWDESHRLTVEALRQAVDDLHKEAFARVIRGIKAEPAALEALKQVASDEVVYAVLRYLELVKPSLHERIEQALGSVRPLLQGHGGNVELVSVAPPDTVEIQLVGACDGCPSSGLTLTEGIEKAIREHCPEILTIKKVKGSLPASNGHGAAVSFISPFALRSDTGWHAAVTLEEIPDAGIKVLELNGQSLLFSRQDHRVTCFENACAHMGMPLDMGEVEQGVITCPYHGFRYDLSSGECLTAPEVQLVPRAVRVVGSTVEVKLKG